MATVKVAVKSVIDAEGRPIGSEGAGDPAGVQFKFSDGTTERLMLSELSEAAKVRLIIHGASQKGGDSYASAAKAEDPLEFSKEALRETLQNLRDMKTHADWRAAAGPGTPKVTILARAMARITGQDAAEWQAAIDKMSKEEQAAYRNKKKVAATLDILRAEDAKAAAERLAAKAAKAQAENTDEEEEEEEEFPLPKSEEEEEE